MFSAQRGETPLSEAARFGSVNVAEFLMDLGADPSSEDLRIAIEQGHVDVARGLVKRRPSFKAGRLANDDLILTSVFSGFSDARETLRTLVVDIGVDVNAKGKDGESIVHVAASKGHQTTIELLEQLGADMSIEDKSGQTPLEILETLLKTSSAPSRAQKESWALDIIASWHAPLMRSVSADILGSSTVIESKWRAEGMDQRLAAIWIRVFSGKTLRQWHERIGTALDALHLKCFDITYEVSTSTPSTRCLGSTCQSAAHDLVDSLLGSTGTTDRDMFCKACSIQMDESEIQTLVDFYASDLGRRFALGHRKKQIDITHIGLVFKRLIANV